MSVALRPGWSSTPVLKGWTVISAEGQIRPASPRRAIGPLRLEPFATPGRVAGGRFFHARGFSLIELFVVVGIIAAVTAFTLAMVTRARSTAHSVTCVSHLHQIAAGFIQYAGDNERRFPDPTVLQQSWEQCLRPYLSDALVFQCPADQEIYATVGSSFDWRDTGRPETTLSGKAITDTNRDGPVLAFESLPGWHSRGKINAALLNGSAQVMDEETCLGDIQAPLRGIAGTSTSAGR